MDRHRRSAGTGRLASTRRLWRITGEALRLVRDGHPRTFWKSAAAQVVGALGTIAIVYAAKITVSLLLETQRQGINIGDFVGPVVLLSLATAITGSAAASRAQQQRVLGEHASRLAWARLLAVTSRVDLEVYESPEFFDRLERLQSNTITRPIAVANAVLGIVSGLVGIVGLMIALATIAPLLVVPLVLGAAPSLWLAKKASDSEFAFASAYGEIWRRRHYLRDLLTSRDPAKEVRAFEASDLLIGRHETLTDEYAAALGRQVRKRQLLSVATVAVSAFLLAGTLALLVYLLDRGRVSLQSAAAAIIAIRLLSTQLSSLFGSVGSIVESGVFLEEFEEFVGNTPVADVPAASRRELSRSVDLHGVTYHYPGTTVEALAGVDLHIPAGEIVALVGENGSGKTTLAKIVGGLYAPTSGTVSWDGAPIGPDDRQQLRASTAVIFQDFVRYHLSLRDNVALGDPDRLSAGADAQLDDDVRRALALAGAGFVSTLPDGLDTILSREYTGGTELSVGQWQRVALARALFRSAPLVVLDEPSASMDPRAEHELFADVRRLVAGRAALFVSHRYGNLHLADRIYVMQAGRVVEHGSHDELLAAGGVYASLYRLQADAYAAGLLGQARES
ncbi:MAG: ATP-binding cassette, subfamily bacterial [Frankiaceae bacterium]|nr:ATP-binding cassette, subfamily bacterial [Frankiaceae bacterium]